MNNNSFAANSPSASQPHSFESSWQWTTFRLRQMCEVLGLKMAFTQDFSAFSRSDLAENSRDVLLLRCSDRSVQDLREIEGKLAQTPSRLIVPVWDDWSQGIRRNLRFKGLEAVYWFEIYRLWNSLVALSTSDVAAQLADQSSRNLVYFFSESAESRNAIRDACVSFGWATTTIRYGAGIPGGNPKCVIWHPPFGNQSNEAELDFLARIGIAYPDATRFRISGFPRFDTSAQLLNQGLDFECGEPYDLGAILGISSFFSSAALRRK